MRIEPTGATLGAYVYEVSLDGLNDETFTAIHRAWLEHGVLVFPGQFLSEAAHVAFSRRFGTLERLLGRAFEAANPEIYDLTNVREDGTLDPPGDPRQLVTRGNQGWHTDSSFKRVPAKASVLRADRAPTTGGETEWADMRAAYDALDPGEARWLEDRVAVHWYVYSQGLIGGLEIMTEAEKEAVPPVEHPIVRVHPETGRRCLYIGRHASHIVGEDVEESRARLGRLCDEACQPPRTFRHAWRAGDVAIWDNRCVLHRGHPWPPDQARVMARTTVAGEGAANEWDMPAANAGG